MQPILVTGGAGFIGAHTCKALAADGLHPIAFDNLSRGYRDMVRWGPFIDGDILQPADLDRAFERLVLARRQLLSAPPRSRRSLTALRFAISPLRLISTRR